MKLFVQNLVATHAQGPAGLTRSVVPAMASPTVTATQGTILKTKGANRSISIVSVSFQLVIDEYNICRISL